MHLVPVLQQATGHMQEGLPEGVAVVSIKDGLATVRRKNSAYEAKLTLVAAPAHAASVPSAPSASQLMPESAEQPHHLKAGQSDVSAPNVAARPEPQDVDMADAAEDAQGHGAETVDTVMAGAAAEEAGATRSDAHDAQFGTDGPDKWRWRLVSLEVLPGKHLRPEVNCSMGLF